MLLLDMFAALLNSQCVFNVNCKMCMSGLPLLSNMVT